MSLYEKYLVTEEKNYYGYTEAEVKRALRKDKRKDARNKFIEHIVTVAGKFGPFKALKLLALAFAARGAWKASKDAKEKFKQLEKDLKTKKVRDIDPRDYQ